jgi:transposase
VAKALRINISTAKLIFKKFKETGSFFNKKMCKPKYKNKKTAIKPKLEEDASPQQK